MIPLFEARQHVLSRVAPLDTVRVAAADALGLVVAEPVVSAEDVPPFANSAMDGYAVRAADVRDVPVVLDVTAVIAAGVDPSGITVAPATAVKIMTGAAMPDGADAVVMVERTAAIDGGRVQIEHAATSGENVRGVGGDVRAGDVVVGVETTVTAAHVGVLASVGAREVVVHRRPRVGVLSTGDELVEGGAPLRPGQLRDSNRHTLLPMVAAAGCDAIDLGLVRDDRATVAAALEAAVHECDALLTSGGVSMGDYDEVKAVLSELADDMRWMQIAIRPAKPFAFGVIARGDRSLPVFGLPGNPVSSVVSFELLARPALRRMLGHNPAELDRPRLAATAAEPLRRKPDGKVHFVRVAVSVTQDGRLVARSAGGQGSHQLTAFAAANGLAVLDDGDGVDEGGLVEVIVLGELERHTSP